FRNGDEKSPDFTAWYNGSVDVQIVGTGDGACEKSSFGCSDAATICAYKCRIEGRCQSQVEVNGKETACHSQWKPHERRYLCGNARCSGKWDSGTAMDMRHRGCALK